MKHTIAHFDIPADDVERAKEFYSKLFDWQIELAPGYDNYWMIQIGDEQDLDGGLMQREAPEQGPVNYIGVESVADYLAKVEALGGTVVIPRMPVPGMGWFAHCRDPEGNAFALWEDDQSAG